MDHFWRITAKISEGLGLAFSRSPQAESRAVPRVRGPQLAGEVGDSGGSARTERAWKDRSTPKAQSAIKLDADEQQPSQLGRDGQSYKRQRMEEQSTQGVRHRRVEAGAISSGVRAQAPADSGWAGVHSALRQTHLFPAYQNKFSQVTPSLRDKAVAKAANTADNAVTSPQQALLPPVVSQYDSFKFSAEGILPKRQPRRRKGRSTRDLARRLQHAHISQQAAQQEENDVELLQHVRPAAASPSVSGAHQTMYPEWHQHTKRYQELDKGWVQEERRIEEEDAYNRKLAEAYERARASKIKSDESLLKAEVASSRLSFADRQVEQAQAHRLAMCAQTPFLAQRISLAQTQAEPTGTQKSTPSAKAPSDQVVLLSDSDDEPAQQHVEVQQDSGGAVDLVSVSDESAASESEDEEDNVFPNSASLCLDMPERVVAGSLLSAYEQLVHKLRQYNTVVSHERAHVGITGEDFHTLAPHQWLGDSCINMYIALLQDRDKQWYQASGQKRSRCLFMNSHFLAKLCQEAGGYNFSNVQRWTAPRKLKALKIDYYGGIKDLDKMVVPVHLGNHWTCAVLNFGKQCIEYYDSLGGTDSETINGLLQWVEDEYQDKYKEPPPERFQKKNWTKLLNPAGTPRQLNGHDCGVFALMCCNYVAADREFDYNQDEVHAFFRKMCCLECYCMRLRSVDL